MCKKFLYIKSSKRQGVLTACVNPFWYLNRMTCFNGSPLPVCAIFSVLVRVNPTSAFLRADLAALALSAPMPKKFFATFCFLTGGPIVVVVESAAFCFFDFSGSTTTGSGSAAVSFVTFALLGWFQCLELVFFLVGDEAAFAAVSRSLIVSKRAL